jgi:hypothetical protein
VGPRGGLEAVWVPETVWRLCGSQRRSGGCVSPRGGLEAVWVPEAVWRLCGSQRRSGGCVGPRDGLEAVWVPEAVWRVCGGHCEATCRRQCNPNLRHPTGNSVTTPTATPFGNIAPDTDFTLNHSLSPLCNNVFVAKKYLVDTPLPAGLQLHGCLHSHRKTSTLYTYQVSVKCLNRSGVSDS